VSASACHLENRFGDVVDAMLAGHALDPDLDDRESRARQKGSLAGCDGAA
jgi:hypothetical protein